MSKKQMVHQTKSISSQKMSVCAVDLFCGAGGLTHGLIKAGVDVRLGVDIDPACEYPYRANNDAEFLLKSVELVKSDDIAPHFKKAVSQQMIDEGRK